MALNDPQWGKRGNDGPPDLDEILRKFNQASLVAKAAAQTTARRADRHRP
jgi:ribosomal protein L12E/L44/L45/RPP1/RPP2